MIKEDMGGPLGRRPFLRLVGCSSVGLAASALGKSVDSRQLRFVQLCDPQLGMGGYEADVRRFKQAVTQINQLAPDFVAICGDLVHHPNDKSFDDFLAIKNELTMPCYCVPGNHDVGNKPTAKSLERYRSLLGKDYFTAEHKGVSIIALNSQLWKAPLAPETAVQDAWLKKAFSTIKTEHAIVVSHYPWFLKTVDEPESYFNLSPEIRAEHFPLFAKHGVSAVLTGHAHKLIEHKHNGIQFVTGETTSKNFDKRPFGFRVWEVDQPAQKQEFVALEK